MHVLAVPDKFRGTATAEQVCAAIAGAVVAAGSSCRSLPIADGGEGMLEAFGGPNRLTAVTGPAGGPVPARWRINVDGPGGHRIGAGLRAAAHRRCRSQRPGCRDYARGRVTDRRGLSRGGGPDTRGPRRLGDHRWRTRGGRCGNRRWPARRCAFSLARHLLRRPDPIHRRSKSIRPAEGCFTCRRQLSDRSAIPAGGVLSTVRHQRRRNPRLRGGRWAGRRFGRHRGEPRRRLRPDRARARAGQDAC